MSFRIKTRLKIEDMDYTLPLPQTQKDFDKYLTEAGILTGDRSEYGIAEIECDNYILNNALDGTWDIEELNYLAQRLDRMNESDLYNYALIIEEKKENGGITKNQMIDLAIKLEDIEIQSNITDTEELGRRYVNENCPNLDPLVIDNINYDSLGDDVKLEELGEFTDAGYIKEFNKIFLDSNSSYDGKSFPFFDYENGYSLKIRMFNGAFDFDDSEEYVDVILPAADTVFARAMRRLKADNLHECLISHFNSDKFGDDITDQMSFDEDINVVNAFAMKLDKIPDNLVKGFKSAIDYKLYNGDVKAMTELVDQFLSGEYAKEKETQDCREEILRRLTDSAVDMAKFMGKDAASDVAALRTQVVDFVNKWGLTENWIEQFDMDVAEFMPEDQNETQEAESGMGMNMM